MNILDLILPLTSILLCLIGLSLTVLLAHSFDFDLSIFSFQYVENVIGNYFLIKIIVNICSRNIYLQYYLLIIALSNDIQLNPGPHFESFIKDLSVCHINAQSMFHKLYNNHVLENDKCSCGQTESTEHYILNCTNYREVRENTLGRITVPYNIDILLKGCPLYSDDVNREIFLEVHNFILKTKRFD